MTFTLREFYDVCSSIETRLGILRANEAVKEWWDAWQRELDQQGVVRHLEFQWDSTPGQSQYAVHFRYPYMPVFDGPTSDGVDPREYVELYARQAWDNGKAWSDGLWNYLVDLCAPFTRPGLDEMRGALSELSSVRVQLQGCVPVDWTELNVEDWTGGAKDAFQNVVDKLAERMKQYELYYSHAESWFAAAAALTSQTQEGLLPFLHEVDDQLDQQLRSWVEGEGHPADRTGPEPWIADVLNIGRQVVGFIPVADTAVSTVESVVSLTKDSLALVGVEPKFKTAAPFKVVRAEQIYQGLTSTLYENYLQKFQESLDEMGTKSQGVMKAIADMGPYWMPPVVGDEGRHPQWEHENEG